MPCALEKRSGCFAISKMSACFVIAQNGSQPSGAKYATGASARRRVHTSCGIPAARVALGIDQVEDVDVGVMAFAVPAAGRAGARR